ncbi:uncharacterized protein Z519_06815 [Cladophialophora bantiana CBS 173.52]|uniref:Uncharacterized protein n=1 Tax=Cladophialophora bantiana (strain ATCC 10958 / CBS 173.52 / CDC B-1940 / NIH 8579) TaxID=1442370 RepID=A0A0D2ESX5_CLAB1|nr:uncharacterized protein Z519_06815 [Cladophialophora bantiana CBS 173.52]KIW92966.1 hypothetical protein Z519_06815 [Cladophialophora bantiana CBS 173.52]
MESTLSSEKIRAHKGAITLALGERDNGSDERRLQVREEAGRDSNNNEGYADKRRTAVIVSTTEPQYTPAAKSSSVSDPEGKPRVSHSSNIAGSKDPLPPEPRPVHFSERVDTDRQAREEDQYHIRTRRRRPITAEKDKR